jgi:hypothetical protein
MHVKILVNFIYVYGNINYREPLNSKHNRMHNIKLKTHELKEACLASSELEWVRRITEFLV